ncbi:MAG: hypothetical protein M1834_002221 [Cirrosporium novae-zelandiae]|nr:MAG: hypothetical protein M1834_002221 [Cirrosporium novae-zelandiae]
MFSIWFNTFLISALLFPAWAVSSEFNDDDDLATFRPDLRPPIFSVTTHKHDITPGYWFTTPYDNLYGAHGGDRYETCQVGPHIYDNDGNLVWSGACLDKNRPVVDLKVFSKEDGSSFISFLLAADNHQEDKRGVGWILDNTYTLNKTVYWRKEDEPGNFNMHEFNIVDGGKSALVIISEFRSTDISALPRKSGEGLIFNNGFRELDVETGDVKFEWMALDHIPITRSKAPMPVKFGEKNSGSWDYIHMNSVDKNAKGDYLISGRHICAIYKISAKDGHIIWQLGGYGSSFKLDKFDFCFQHDARLRYESEDESIAIVSFLNNAADKTDQTEKHSSALLVKLNMTSMVATLINEWDRPDHGITRKRGNVQFLDESNHTFVCWSENSYVSEYTPDGKMVLEARFNSDRFGTYRTYKFNFTGRPTEPPALKAYTYGSHRDTKTVHYVSWNGATEVASWSFYGKQDHATSSPWTFIGSTNKTGFETRFIADGYMRYVMVEGVAKDGERLGNSTVERTTIPPLLVSSSTHASNHIPIKNSTENSASQPQSMILKLRISSLIHEVRTWLTAFVVACGLCVLILLAGFIYYCCLRRRLHMYQPCEDGYSSVEGQERGEMGSPVGDMKSRESLYESTGLLSGENEDDHHPQGEVKS